MKKLKLVLLLIIICLSTGFFEVINAQVNFQAPEEDFSTLEPYTSIPWGSQRSDFLDLISQQEGMQIDEVSKEKVTVKYFDEAVLIFGFSNNGLYQSILLSQLNSGYNSYKELINAFTDKYGKPKIDNGMYIWGEQNLGISIKIKDGMFWLSFLNKKISNQ
jgi:hypothetical protein